ncbi:hypothetical protein ATANTOWER_017104 [Ataeniobius toweri]|uniref:Uncharacterized protein n=1 Tax=Ataeniobius toweri TaxID=208326 RepID=A0ABU7B739_9TELE|nr:hypothetical protein [Ataeniobius toweri]
MLLTVLSLYCFSYSVFIPTSRLFQSVLVVVCVVQDNTCPWSLLCYGSSLSTVYVLRYILTLLSNFALFAVISAFNFVLSILFLEATPGLSLCLPVTPLWRGEPSELLLATT